MTKTCFVRAADYATHFDHVPDPEVEPAPVWSGVERRIATTERRAVVDRRWDGQRGRRYRLADRRKGPRP